MKAPVTQCRNLSINKHLCLLLFFFVSLVPCLHAQSIGINSSPANNSASLDIGATTLTPKLGLLIPRVTLAERTTMNPLNQAAQGLMVYQTNMVEGFYYNTSTTTTPNWLYLPPGSAAGSWSLTGNAGTDTAINFLGTTDGQPLMFKVNNIKSGYIDFEGNNQNTGFGFQTLYVNTPGGSFGFDGTQNTAHGYKALLSNTVGFNNTAIGAQALQANITGFTNTAIGADALLVNTYGIANTATGANSLNWNTIGAWNTANGMDALLYNTTGIQNTAVGYVVLYHNVTGNSNTASGAEALLNNTSGNNNTAYGDSALYTNTTGSNNTALGYGANVSSGILTNATAIGANAIVGASNSLVLGGTGTSTVNVGIGITIPQERLDVIGNIRSSTLAPNGIKMVQADNNGTLIQLVPGSASQVLLGTGVWGSFPGSANDWSITGNAGTVDNSNFIGTTDNIPFNIKVNNQKAGRIDHLLFNTFYGYMAGNVNTGNWNTAIGNVALRDNTTGHDNTATGDETLTFNTSGFANTANGEGSLFRNTTGNNNSANGYSVLAFNTTGNSNVAMGANALYNNSTTSNLVAIGDSALFNNGTGALGKDATENTALGSKALFANTTGSNNTAGGYHTLINNTTGAWNTAIGDMALKQNTSGNKNTALGYGADVSANNLVNATAIGYNAIVATSNSMVLGATSADIINVAIGYTSPLSRLDVNGAIGTTIKKITVNTTLDNTAAVWYASPLPLSPMTLTLPSAGTVTNRRYVVVNRSASTVNISGYTNLNGTSTTTISANSSIEIISDGTDWLQIK